MQSATVLMKYLVSEVLPGMIHPYTGLQLSTQCTQGYLMQADCTKRLATWLYHLHNGN